MKTITYGGRGIQIGDPASIFFADAFHQRLYSLVYNSIANGTPYGPVIDVDHIHDLSLGLDLPAEALASGIALKRQPAASAANRNRLLVQHYVQHFLESYPEMLGLFQNVILSANTAIQNAEVLFGAHCDGRNFIEIKQIIDHLNVNAWNRQRDGSETQSGVSTLGAISERLLECVFIDMLDETNFFKVSSPKVNSYGDFVLMCLPNNLWISVKSNFARERLLASGYNNDILGAGFFQEFTEFTSQVKIRNFQRAGFLAMYCPDVAISPLQVANGTNTFDQVVNFYAQAGRRMPQNINGTPFIRRLSELGSDIQALLDEVSTKRRFTVGF